MKFARVTVGHFSLSWIPDYHRSKRCKDKRKLQAKGIASVGARVMNLKEA